MAENIFEKYKRLRPLIKDGDLILFHGTGFIAKIIQSCDRSYYNHIGVVFEKCGALYILDANANGVQADRLSKRIEKYKDGNFTIIKPLKTNDEIQLELTKLLKRSDEKWIKYDFYNGIKELLNRKFNWNLKINFDENHDICSDFVSQYQYNLGLYNEHYKSIRICFPQDTIRYLTDQGLIIN